MTFLTTHRQVAKKPFQAGISHLLFRSIIILIIPIHKLISFLNVCNRILRVK